MKGVIALDIDGTLTHDLQPIGSDILKYLEFLSSEGWILSFMTGRTYSFAFEHLKKLTCPYYLALQNGSLLLEMPSKKVIGRNYLKSSILLELEKISFSQRLDFVIYSGFEKEDICYYRTENFTPELLNYLMDRKQAFSEIWQETKSFQLPDLKEFPVVKYFAPHSDALKIAKKIEEGLNLNVPVISDPFNSNYFIAQATPKGISKGTVLRDLLKLCCHQGIVIAAGDDYNDLCMLKAADVKIVMEDAPKELLLIADIVARNGIIQALKEAIRKSAKK